MILCTTVTISDMRVLREQQLALTAVEAGLVFFGTSGSSPDYRLLSVGLTFQALWNVPSRLRQQFLLFVQH